MRRHIRIGDAQRRSTDAVLAQAMASGYLTWDEWHDRTASVRTATTVGALDAVTADLPVDRLRRQDPVARSERTAATRRDLRTRTAGWLGLAALLITIWLAVAIPTGAWYPWPVWPILGTGIGLVSHVLPARAALRSS
ncbi:DUF1707 domain-containing protein [Nakamurella deserti]|uniref:DUF1707 domain-containing protein n=1 Tax=Nakamurella deserti TaxID=2164074 RepID=UPI00197B74EE|nr:DUF1707 domain-containing protein [Nakamurella deserti]